MHDEEHMALLLNGEESQWILLRESKELVNFLPRYNGCLVRKWGYRSEDAPLGFQTRAGGSSGPTNVSLSSASYSDERKSNFVNLEHITK
ncbi:hypothetical protein V6N12_046025 [Hibiscus sabdariffa]|uniref:Uncharacterized protein n=1 Tax=Hibiscus sabdariffa TaxID=183260 RepID=A0ABR2G5L2_9ROSI